MKIYNNIEQPIKNKHVKINKYKFNIISTSYIYTKYIILQNPIKFITTHKHVYNIRYESYNHPLLIYIYEFLIDKLNSDLVEIIINNYINSIDYMNNENIKKKYSINNYLNFNQTGSYDYCKIKKKYYIARIYYNNNPNPCSYTYYKYNLKYFIEGEFLNQLNFILNKFINI